ncbi:ribosomal large subunit pseudouridine synthase D [Treponema primitia ZAS-2]|uniref:Ribosomal large subunit pseudouridine synthase D n=1 Tax=Treponema primitia (strain ATCC BAA-887 / DSM 12427 / ZAS-2) TaxID=545694 RepID=F5YQS3_TREPZ|nr:RluA family pseudouridine synthase [Treponema primitia]AEF84870.1 ribosomal large subunit pseudouridine synthase D [Treponema primitia ZAS-2]
MKPAYPRTLAQGLVLIYEDRDILVADKPPGLLSIATGSEREKTAYWILSEYLRKKGEKRRAAVVHRLDRDTSGVMLFAKSEAVKRKLMEHWDETVEERRYLALAEGEFAEAQGIIDAPLGEDSRGRVVVVRGGQQNGAASKTWRAITHWKLLKAGNGFSLLSLELETGRRNQIRAHLAHLGHPVAGDPKYGAKTNPLKRLCLHAEVLVFHHPHDGKLMEFEVKVPGGFFQVLGPRSR